MEYVDGVDLYDILAEAKRMPSEVAALIARGVAEGLEHAHSRGIVHRDIKPSNIILSKKGEIKIMDFGSPETPERATSPEPVWRSVRPRTWRPSRSAATPSTFGPTSSRWASSFTRCSRAASRGSKRKVGRSRSRCSTNRWCPALCCARRSADARNDRRALSEKTPPTTASARRTS